MMSLMDTDADLLTSQQVAFLLGRSPKTVIRMALAGTLPVAQRLPGPNGAFLFRRPDIEALTEPKASA